MNDLECLFIEIIDLILWGKEFILYVFSGKIVMSVMMWEGY